jgi:signal transduction histidine kinase
MVKDDNELTVHMRHEVRNALACIHQFGNILVDGLAGELTPEQREYIEIMLENARKIREVLDHTIQTVGSDSLGERVNQHKVVNEKET